MRFTNLQLIGYFFLALSSVLLVLSLTHYWDATPWKILRIAMIGGFFFWVEQYQQKPVPAAEEPESTLTA